MSQAPAKTHRALRWIIGLFLLLTLLLLGWGLMHQSEYPQLLGRYSYGYAMLLAALAVASLFQVLLLCCASERLLTLAGNLYTLLISTVVVLLLTELLLRAVNPWGMDFFHNLPYHMQGMVDDPELGYRHPRSVQYTLGDNQVSLNSKGLRDEEIDYPKPAGERRILALGDSVTFGWGTDQGDSFADRMEPLLQQRTGDHWQVINAGVNGYNTEQEQRWLQTEGLRYQPDIVLLTYVINDADAPIDPNETTWRRHPEWPSSLPEAMDRIKRLSFLFQAINMFSRMGQAHDADNAAGATEPSITDNPRWPQSHAALKAIADELKQRDISFLVARNSGSDPRFFEQLAADGIAAISLDPAWEKVPAELARVSLMDPHPSALVHAEMAALLVDELALRGWLNPPATSQ